VAIAHMVLNFIAFADPPLPIPMLEHAISVSAKGGTLRPGDIIREATISDLCSSLIRKSLDEERGFEFAHFSVREFLDSDELAEHGLGDFRVSHSDCNRLLAVQCLRYLLLDNFNESPEATVEGILSVAQGNEHYPFYYYASFFWARHARSEWANHADCTLMDTAARLFDPRKTPAFSRWAVTLSLEIAAFIRIRRPSNSFSEMIELMKDAIHRSTGKPTDLAAIIMVVSSVLDRNFRPVHLAAILRLSEICKLHLHDPTPAHAVNRHSPLGTPLQFAIGGILLLCGCPRSFWEKTLWDAQQSWKLGVLGFFYRPSRTGSSDFPDVSSREVECLLAAATECVHWPLPGKDSSLLDFATIDAYGLADFSLVALLLESGITPTHNELAWLECAVRKLAFERKGMYADPDRVDRALRAFVMSVNDLVGRLPDVLPLACMVWKIAVRSDPSLDEHTSMLDTRMWLADDALLERAIGTVESANVDALAFLLRDPRLDQIRLHRTKDGGSLLHVATHIGDSDTIRLQKFPASDGQNAVMTAAQLLEAGFSPTAINDKEETPLHIWNWESRIEFWSGPWRQSLRDLARAFIQAGLNVEMTDQRGNNVLHANVGRPQQFTAILDFADTETTGRALQATNHQGCTPLMEALRIGDERSVNAILQSCAERPIAQVVIDLSSSAGVEFVQRLLDSGMCVCLSEHPSPLHRLGRGASLNCVKLLKTLYPRSCGTRTKGRLPLDNYLLRQGANYCLEAVPAFPEVLRELAIVDFQANDDKEAKADTWKYFTRTLQKARGSNTAASHELSDLVVPAVHCLIDLGYLEAYEAATGECGLIWMLVALEPEKWESMDDLLPLSAESILAAVKNTTRWSLFENSLVAAQLLWAAVNSDNIQLIQSMLARGLDLYQGHEGLSCLEAICHCRIKRDDHTKQSLFRLLLDHAGLSELNALNPATQRGLIHEAAAGDSAWVVEELIRRGADPNLRTGPAGISRPALSNHISRGSINSAIALLHNGADPTMLDAYQMDAAIVAASYGSSSFLKELALAEKRFPWRINWQRTCTVPFPENGSGNRSGLSALHLAASHGNVETLRFYLDRQLLGNIDCLDSDGLTPLIHAAWTGQMHQVDYLCRNGANPDFQCPNHGPNHGRTALHFAVLGAHFTTVQTLLQHGAKSLPDFEGTRPLFLAYEIGDQGIIQALRPSDDTFTLRPAPNATSISPSQDTTNQQHQRGLAHALQAGIRSGNLELCKQLRTSGCHLDVDLDCGGCSPLILATEYSRFDIAKWLLENGASTTKISCRQHRGANRNTPLEYLLSQPSIEDTELIQAFIDKFLTDGGDIMEEGLLVCAASFGNTTALRLLLEQRKKLATHSR
jgi:ankyrin repeat protein